jgi:hypothetical protein
MRPKLKRMLNEPGNDMIVIPFNHAHEFLTGFVPVRTDRFRSILAAFYDPDPYPPGSCIQ